MLFFDMSLFSRLTPLNLLLMLGLILYTQPGKNRAFYVFMITIMILGFVSEVIGTSTGMLFGQYSYGEVLGVKLFNVPLIIAVNWFLVIYCCAISIHMLLSGVVQRLADRLGTKPPALQFITIVFDGAVLATLFDWIIEPVAIRLGYWQWAGKIPLYNYISWFLVSGLMLWIFHISLFPKRNKFAVNLLMIQVMFFLLLSALL
jgi:putative membrane protein